MQEGVQLLLNIIRIIIGKDVKIVLDAINQLVNVLLDVSLIAKAWRSSMLVHEVLVELLTGHHQLGVSQVRCGKLVR